MSKDSDYQQLLAVINQKRQQYASMSLTPEQIKTALEPELAFLAHLEADE